MAILMMQSVENFKSTGISSECLPACRPEVIPTGTRSKAPDFSHNTLGQVLLAQLDFSE